MNTIARRTTATRGFVHEALAMRTVFGAGRLDRLADEADRLGLRRVLVLSTPRRRGLAEKAAAVLGRRVAGIHDRAAMHVPIEVADEAADEARRLGADGTVAIGGGSTIGLAKAIALRLDLPIIAVPTTYAGSEMTAMWGQTEGGLKTTGRDPRVLPRTTIYDCELTLGLPAEVSGQSGINAIAHCVEALYAENANPVTSLMAEEGIRALATSLPRVVAQGSDIEARDAALLGAWLSGIVLGVAGVALHHKLCHTLGGSFDLPHAVVGPRFDARWSARRAPQSVGRPAASRGSRRRARWAGSLKGWVRVVLVRLKCGAALSNSAIAARASSSRPSAIKLMMVTMRHSGIGLPIRSMAASASSYSSVQ